MLREQNYFHLGNNLPSSRRRIA